MRTHSTRPRSTILVTSLSLVLAMAPVNFVYAQSGGTLDLRRNVVAGGGTTSTGSGNVQVSGTVGQPAAGPPKTGGPFTQQGGFWAAIPDVLLANDSFQFSAASTTISEGAGKVTLIVTRTGNTAIPAAVNFATVDGTATRKVTTP